MIVLAAPERVGNVHYVKGFMGCLQIIFNFFSDILLK